MVVVVPLTAGFLDLLRFLFLLRLLDLSPLVLLLVDSSPSLDVLVLGIFGVEMPLMGSTAISEGAMIGWRGLVLGTELFFLDGFISAPTIPKDRMALFPNAVVESRKTERKE